MREVLNEAGGCDITFYLMEKTNGCDGKREGDKLSIWIDCWCPNSFSGLSVKKWYFYQPRALWPWRTYQIRIYRSQIKSIIGKSVNDAKRCKFIMQQAIETSTSMRNNALRKLHKTNADIENVVYERGNMAWGQGAASTRTIHEATKAADWWFAIDMAYSVPMLVCNYGKNNSSIFLLHNDMVIIFFETECFVHFYLKANLQFLHLSERRYWGPCNSPQNHFPQQEKSSSLQRHWHQTNMVSCSRPKKEHFYLQTRALIKITWLIYARKIPGCWMRLRFPVQAEEYHFVE